MDSRGQDEKAQPERNLPRYGRARKGRPPEPGTQSQLPGGGNISPETWGWAGGMCAPGRVSCTACTTVPLLWSACGLLGPGRTKQAVSTPVPPFLVL